jgi:hypothetical protein
MKVRERSTVESGEASSGKRSAMRNRRCAVVAVLAFVLFALALASASITGSTSGVVTDKWGAVVSGASVVATNTLTGVQNTQKTGSTSFDATNVFNSGLSRALSIFDFPQDLTVSYTVQMPFDRLTGGAARRLTAGWALSVIATFAKGEPVQLSESDDNSLSGTFDATIDEPQVVGGPLFVNRNPRSGQPYFNPNYFAPENLGTVGNAMRRFFSGPRIDNFDMALLKDTRITEKCRCSSVQKRSMSSIMPSS